MNDNFFFFFFPLYLLLISLFNLSIREILLDQHPIESLLQEFNNFLDLNSDTTLRDNFGPKLSY